MDPTLPVAPESRRDRSLQVDKAPPPVDVDLDLGDFGSGLLQVQTCPQCGVNPAGRAKPRTFQWVPPWVYVGLALNIVVLLILYYVGRQRATASLPLCADCEAADKRGRTLTGLSYAGVFVAPAIFAIAGSVFSAEVAGWSALAGFVAGLVGAITTTLKMRGSTINCRRIEKGRFVRLRASPTWRTTLEREQPGALLGVGGAEPGR